MNKLLSSVRSETFLPPINGLKHFKSGHGLYKDSVPTALQNSSHHVLYLHTPARWRDRQTSFFRPSICFCCCWICACCSFTALSIVHNIGSLFSCRYPFVLRLTASGRTLCTSCALKPTYSPVPRKPRALSGLYSKRIAQLHQGGEAGCKSAVDILQSIIRENRPRAATDLRGITVNRKPLVRCIRSDANIAAGILQNNFAGSGCGTDEPISGRAVMNVTIVGTDVRR